MFKHLRWLFVVVPALILPALQLTAQTHQVTGQVKAADGSQLDGASVQLKGTQTGTFASQGGHFSLQVPDSGGILVVSYIGYESRDIPIGIKDVVEVTLTRSASSLNELVVVGYGTQKRRDLTGSVSSVSGGAIADLPVTNLTAALQGRAAGVEVVNSSGEPGATPTIIIRGLSSLHQPNPLYIVDGVRQSPDNINIQDIASIDILKDASAAAIYGAAAAGGVVVITTKKGHSATPTVHFSMRYGVTRPKTVKLLNKAGYIKLENMLNPQYFSGATMTDTLADTDWPGVIYRSGTEQNYDLSVSGASPSVNYLFSGFYNAQQGIFIRNYSNIGGVRVNTDYQLGKYIKIGEQLALSQRKTEPVNPLQPQLFNAPFRTLPIIPIYGPDGKIGTIPPGYGISFGGPNPYGMINSADIENIKNNLQGNVYAQITLPFHLSFRTNLGYSYYDELENYFQNNVYFGPGSPANNSLNKFDIRSTQLLSNYVLTYDQTFGKHHVNAIAGYEEISSKFNNINATESSIGLPGYSFIQTSASAVNVSGKYDPNGLIKSEFGRVNYSYNDRYFLSGSIRQDANYTVFGPNKQKGVFSAVSAGWSIGDEAFFKAALPAINALKIRGSYGTLGNSNIPAYSFLSTYGQFSGTSGLANGGQNFAPGAPLLIANSISSVQNPDLHWETVTEANIGLDGEALAGRLYFTAEWYNKITSNMLYALPLPTSSGFSAPYFVNIGKVSSRGVDILVGYKDHAGKFSYDVSATAGFNRNKVEDLDGITNDALYDGRNYYNNLDPSGFNMMGTSSLTITKAGLPFGSFYGYKALGIFKTDKDAEHQKVDGQQSHAGDLRFQDLNGDGNITADDRRVIGNPNPKLVYGVTIRLAYQGFDVAMLFNGVAGVDLFNGVKAYEMFPFSDGNTTSKIFGDSFLGTNQVTSQPRLLNPDGIVSQNNPNYNTVNSFFVESGNYVKLKNLQIGYTFQNSLLRKISIRSARLFVMANNLFTLTHYSGLDPEIGSAYSAESDAGFVGSSVGVTTRGVDAVEQYPQARIYSVGLDLTF